MRWANGDCRFGEKCNFAHGEKELRYLYRTQKSLKTSNGNTNEKFFIEHNETSNFSSKTNFKGYLHSSSFTDDCGDTMRAYEAYPCIWGPGSWVEYYDKATGDPYYHNYNTQITQWERPSKWSIDLFDGLMNKKNIA